MYLKMLQVSRKRGRNVSGWRWSGAEGQPFDRQARGRVCLPYYQAMVVVANLSDCQRLVGLRQSRVECGADFRSARRGVWVPQPARQKADLLRPVSRVSRGAPRYTHES